MQLIQNADFGISNTDRKCEDVERKVKLENKNNIWHLVDRCPHESTLSSQTRMWELQSSMVGAIENNTVKVTALW